MVVSSEIEELRRRKIEHIKVTLLEDVQYKISTWFEDIVLIHNPLPEIDYDKINTCTKLFNRSFNYPLLIDSITGGISLAKNINEKLAELAAKYNIPISCGSQKSILMNKELLNTYKVIKEVCPDCYLIGNIGAHDLIAKSKEIVGELISTINADALAIHLNPLQEVIQTGGHISYANIIDAIRNVVDAVDVPVIVKETGAGISMKVARILESVGVSAINIAGAGGTNWALVEAHRSLYRNNRFLAEIAKTFSTWGIPTAASLIEVLSVVNIPVIASGGIRNGIDVVKSLVLGAKMAGLAHPFIKEYFRGPTHLERLIDKLIFEIKTTMFLVGAKDVPSLKNAEYVIIGNLLQWIKWRGLYNKWIRTVS
ncbi:MAG: type 2 isopentenyl-diphosphate Delta-isomerase [Candidatus Geothermarchaeota archaeon]